MSTDWSKVLRDLVKEHNISVRQLAKVSGVARSTLVRAMSGKTNLHSDQMDHVFRLLGYELDAVKITEPDPSLVLPQFAKPGRPKATVKLIKPACMDARY